MKLHNQMLAALEKGSEVVTNGGMIGTITDLDDRFIATYC